VSVDALFVAWLTVVAQAEAERGMTLARASAPGADRGLPRTATHRY
jgi:hypothetical protein